MSETLKACPFCGSEDVHATVDAVWCSGCGMGKEYLLDAPGTDALVREWNRRATAPNSEPPNKPTP